MPHEPAASGQGIGRQSVHADEIGRTIRNVDVQKLSVVPVKNFGADLVPKVLALHIFSDPKDYIHAPALFYKLRNQPYGVCPIQDADIITDAGIHDDENSGIDVMFFRKFNNADAG